jgi:hypothetical protein
MGDVAGYGYGNAFHTIISTYEVGFHSPLHRELLNNLLSFKISIGVTEPEAIFEPRQDVLGKHLTRARSAATQDESGEKPANPSRPILSSIKFCRET